MNHDEMPRIDRRTAIKWMFTASAGLTLAPYVSLGQHVAAATVVAKGYGTDPDLVKSYQPGELWPLTLTEPQRRTVAVLCDLIIPADANGPSASEVHVHDFIDEWISAPYSANEHDRVVIIDGLSWLDAEAQRRYGQSFANLIGRQRTAICDDICYEPKAKSEFKTAAKFFARFRDLTAGGYYTTPEGMKDLGYIGNVPLATFDGPPVELIKKLGLG